jgi:hypothetical protein
MLTDEMQLQQVANNNLNSISQNLFNIDRDHTTLCSKQEVIAEKRIGPENAVTQCIL